MQIMLNDFFKGSPDKLNDFFKGTPDKLNVFFKEDMSTIKLYFNTSQFIAIFFDLKMLFTAHLITIISDLLVVL